MSDKQQKQAALGDLARDAADAAEAMIPFGMRVVVLVQDEATGTAAFFSQLPAAETLQLFRKVLRDHGVS